ncbi:DUF2789 domain-containing protein [Pokkaliibacter sp. CJK22405]|uniref:DUF2789 domain-containing protein n=1 Tax=Pokkaliibacter sp. CJK22405 TaxID=3384615 RepID=UPI003984F7C1
MMDTSTHSMNTLFAQLGLPESDQQIDQFIQKNGGLSEDIPLHQAQCWSTAQSRFLKEALAQDSDWAETVDELNARMHEMH